MFERLKRRPLGDWPSRLLRSRGRSLTGPHEENGCELIGLDELQDILVRAEEIGHTQSFSERVKFLERFRLSYDQGTLPCDPFSSEYRDTQLRLYEQIAGVDGYDPRVNEVMSVDIEGRLRQPAPFDAGSTAAAGEHLIAYGFLLRLLDLRPGDRVIEYGAGQGNIAMLLAMIGVDVTAIDISPEFIELIRRRAERDGVSIDAVVGEFGDPPRDGSPVDAIVFYEAFHHASDHAGLIRALRERLAPGGRVVFAGEPILEDPNRPWMGPWGVRLDGVSLGAIRQHQCLELGFSASYFVRLLMRNGYLVTYHPCHESGIGNTWIARANDGKIAPNQITLPPDEETSWGPGHSDRAVKYRFAGAQTRLTLDEDERWRAVEVTLRNHLPVNLSATIRVCNASEHVCLAPSEATTVSLPMPSRPRSLIVESTTAVPVELGIGEDATPLGLAVEEVTLVETAQCADSPTAASSD